MVALLEPMTVICCCRNKVAPVEVVAIQIRVNLVIQPSVPNCCIVSLNATGNATAGQPSVEVTLTAGGITPPLAR
jgi:hypothetical protein